MVSTSCLVLHRGLAVAVAVLASSLFGTIAVAQQIAVNVEGQASASGASVSNGRASSGFPRNKSGRTGAPRRKWSDGSPICLGSWRGVRAIPSGRALSISVTRIHGTNQPETIGHAVSSGCFRLDNADVIDLYDRVQVGAKVLVRQSAHIS